MIDKKYQIFISSTYKDLIEPRSKIIESILSLYHFPIGMEMFSAADDEQWDIIKETIDSSDFYIILIGSRYGSTTNEGISYTEKEYDYAKSIGVPILSFVRDTGVPTTPEERESDPELTFKLEKFIRKVTANKMCQFWRTSDELALKVNTALTKEFLRKKRVGWVRGDSVSEEASKELISLSKENRELRDRISRLEALNQARKPEIELNILNKIPLELYVPNVQWSDFLISTPQELSTEIPEHLTDYISVSAIRRYNRELPSIQEVEEYNKNLKIFLLSKFAITLQMEVTNLGNGPANNINIEIDFPNFVKIFKKKTLDSISFPKDIIPENPLIKAQEKFESINGNGLFKRDMSSLLIRENFLRNYSEFTIPSVPDIHPSYSIEDNRFLIDFTKLLHSRKDTIFDYLSIVPIKVGSGNININIICEEMEYPKKIQVPINVQIDSSLNILERK